MAPLAVLRLGGQACEYVGWLLLARRLGSAPFGTLSVGFLLARYGGLAGDLGASFRGARDVASSARAGSIGTYLTKRSRATAVLSFAFVAGAVASGNRAEVPLVAVLAGVGLSRDWIAIGREQGARAGLPPAVQGVVLAVGALAGGPGAVVVGLAYGMAGALSVALNRPGPPGPPATEQHRHALSAVMANQVVSSADTLLLGGLRTSSEAGVYAAVYRLPNALLAVIALVLSSLVPAVVHASERDEATRLRLLRWSLRVSFRGALMIVLLAPVGWLLVPALLGEAYRSGRGPLVVLLVATAVIAWASPLHPFTLAAGEDRAYAGVLAVGATVNVAANLALIPLFGMWGAACATLLAQTLISTWLWRRIARPSSGDVEHPLE